MSQSTNPLSNLRITMNFPPTSWYNTIPSNTQSKVHRSATCRISLLEEKLHHDAKTASNLARISSASFSHHVGNVGIPAEKEEKRRGAVRNIGKISRSRFITWSLVEREEKRRSFYCGTSFQVDQCPYSIRSLEYEGVLQLYIVEGWKHHYSNSLRAREPVPGEGTRGDHRATAALFALHTLCRKARSVLVYDCFVYAVGFDEWSRAITLLLLLLFFLFRLFFRTPPKTRIHNRRLNFTNFVSRSPLSPSIIIRYSSYIRNPAASAIFAPLLHINGICAGVICGFLRPPIGRTVRVFGVNNSKKFDSVYPASYLLITTIPHIITASKKAYLRAVFLVWFLYFNSICSIFAFIIDLHVFAVETLPKQIVNFDIFLSIYLYTIFGLKVLYYYKV